MQRSVSIAWQRQRRAVHLTRSSIMAGPMQPNTSAETPLEPSAGSRTLGLGVEWESPWQVFRTSVRDSFQGPRPPKDSAALEPSVLRVAWITGKLPGRAFAASSLSHVAAILILLLPVGGFFPSEKQNLAPVQIESTLYFRPQDLPRISPAKPSPRRGLPDDASKPLARSGEKAYHGRQTILSIPVHVTHPRQTMLEPDAPATPPKIVPPLPNIVQWAKDAGPTPRLQLALRVVAPLIKQRAVGDVAAPEVPNKEKNSGPLNIASATAVNPQPPMPVNPMSAAKAQQRQPRSDTAKAPEIGASTGDANLRRLIALSAVPGPPAAEVKVPEGNLSARIAISPEGTGAGAPGGPRSSNADSGARSGRNAGPAEGGNDAAGDANSLPAAISVSRRSERAASGGIAAARNHSGTRDLRPMASSDLATTPRKSPALIGTIDPGLPPEKILSGREVYTMDVNMPNFTSVTGSWILNFAELDEDDSPSKGGPKGPLSSPVPVEKVDPKYPPTLIREHVDGEVVLYAIIRKDGSVDSIQVVRELDPQLDRNAVEALAQWRFRPGGRDGAPVELEAVVHIPFRFRNPRY
jgi:TonB family protein